MVVWDQRYMNETLSKASKKLCLNFINLCYVYSPKHFRSGDFKCLMLSVSFYYQ